MKKRILVSLLMIASSLLISLSANAQSLSQMQKTQIIKAFDKHIKTISAISTDNIDMINVYKYNLQTSSQFLEENERYVSDKDIYSKYIELKTITNHNKELIDFIAPRVGNLYYIKAVQSLNGKKKEEGYKYLLKAIETSPDNVMANYELSKISLDSGQIVDCCDRLTRILSSMKPSEEEKLLCMNLMAYAYDKNLLTSMSLIKQGKYAYAFDILSQLQIWCKKDAFGICKSSIVEKNIELCQKGIYDNHIDITKKAISKGELVVAGDFVKNTYDYFQRNREGISDTSSFETIVHTVVEGYINQAKNLPQARNSEVRGDLLLKAKELSAMLGGQYESDILKQIASIQGTTIDSDVKLDSIEQMAQNNGYSIDYSQYIKDTVSQPEQEVEKIEQQYIATKENNQQPPQSVAVAVNSTKTINKAVDDKFFETRQLMQVNNYEKALEVLETANRLAKMEGDKQQVAMMYKKAIREITAKRMSKAEYSIFQGDVQTADSLVALTNDLIEAYDMKEDTAIVKIMNSYLRAIDNKVCSKKQDEINTMVVDILDAIQRNDFYTADQYINKAMQIKGNNECRLDKSRLRLLKRQIEEPLQYIEMKAKAQELLEQKDTMKFFLEYAKLENFYNTKKLGDLSVQHTDLREIMYSFKDDDLAIKTTENLIKYKQYEAAIESLGALKNMGYRAKSTKKAQKRIAKMMAFEDMKRQQKIEQSYRIMDKYSNDAWFKYFFKTYKKNIIKFNKLK